MQNALLSSSQIRYLSVHILQVLFYCEFCERFNTANSHGIYIQQFIPFCIGSYSLCTAIPPLSFNISMPWLHMPRPFPWCFFLLFVPLKSEKLDKKCILYVAEEQGQSFMQ